MTKLTDSAYVDAVKATQRDLGPPKFQQIAQSFPDYEVFPRLLKKDKVSIQSGRGIQRNLMTRVPDAARFVAYDEVDRPTQEDLLEQMQVDWCHADTHYTWKRQDRLMNSGDAKLVDLIEMKRAGALLSLVELLDNKFFADYDSTDLTIPWGLKYWIVKYTGTPGFNGGLPSGASDLAGINLTLNPTFKNWAGTYVTISKADLVRKMRQMYRRTRFKSPVTVSDYGASSMLDRYRIYCNDNTIGTIEEIGESQNENLGRDIYAIDGGSMSFKGNPFRPMDQLDADTSDPIYFFNTDTFMPCILKGTYLYEKDAYMDPFKHNWYIVYIDLSLNYVCFDRRRNGVLSK